MNRDRTTAAAAVAFGVLGIVAAVMTGHPPMPEKSAAYIVNWYHDHRQGIYASQLVLALATAALLLFATRVRHEATGGDERARGSAALLATSSAAAVALFLAGGWLQLALAVGVNRPNESLSPSSVRLLSDLTWMHWGGLTIVVAVVAASLSMLLLDGAVGARWVGGLGVVATVLSVVGAVAAFFPNAAGKQNPIAVLGFIGFLAFALTLLLTGITMLVASAGTAEEQPTGSVSAGL